MTRSGKSHVRSISRIVLVGFMGAGKSTVGPILAERLTWRFVDADLYLQSKTGSTIAELFTRLGEPEFRRLEAEAFAELHQERQIVLALGGGAVETESVRRILAESQDTHVVFLKASLEASLGRCNAQTGGALRPLLQDRESLHARFQSRLPFYEKAHTIILTEGLNPHTVAERILSSVADEIEANPLIQKAIAD